MSKLVRPNDSYGKSFSCLLCSSAVGCVTEVETAETCGVAAVEVAESGARVAEYGAFRWSQCCCSGSLMLEPGLLSMEPSGGASAVAQGA
jgi:hypothetical protein